MTVSKTVSSATRRSTQPSSVASSSKAADGSSGTERAQSASRSRRTKKRRLPLFQIVTCAFCVILVTLRCQQNRVFAENDNVQSKKDQSKSQADQINVLDVCTSTKGGELDSAVVYGKNVNYCYPRHGKVEEFWNAAAQTNTRRLKRNDKKKNSQVDGTMRDVTHPINLIFLVTSNAENVHRRNVIRDAWGNKGWVFFIIASSGGGDNSESNSSEATSADLAEEMEQHGDLLLFNIQPESRGTDRLVASLHAVQSHLVNKTLAEKNEFQYGAVLKCNDDAHINVPLLHKDLTILKPDYFGICLKPRQGKKKEEDKSKNDRSPGAGIYPPDGHVAVTNTGFPAWEAKRLVSFPVDVDGTTGMPDRIASSAGYAMSFDFMNCALKKTSIDMPATKTAGEDTAANGVTNRVDTNNLHEDEVVAALASQCGYRCVDSDYAFVRYEADMVVQHKVKTKAEFLVLHEQYTGAKARNGGNEY